MLQLAEEIHGDSWSEAPENMLASVYADQRRIISRWGITLPCEEDLFKPDCPLWLKVSFFDWIIREAM